MSASEFLLTDFTAISIAGSIREYVARYAPEARAAFIRDARLKYLDYDWNLTDVESRP